MGRTRHRASLQRLAEKGVRVAILVLHNQGALRSLLDPTIRVITVPGWRLRYAIPGLRRVVRAVAPRAVLSSGTANQPTLCRGPHPAAAGVPETRPARIRSSFNGAP